MEKTTVSRTGLTFMGTGGAWSVPEYGCPCKICQTMEARGQYRRRSALLWQGSETLLLDCGPDMCRQLWDYRVPKPDAVFLSHEHGDHFLGLDELLSFRRCLPKKEFSLIPLYATEETFNAVETRFGYLIGSVFEKRIIHPGEPAGGLKTTVIPFKTYHGDFAPGSVGLMVEDQGRRLCYTSDFSSLPDWPSFLFEPDTLVIQSYWLHEPVVNRPNHLSFQNAVPYIRKWKAKTVYLTHLSDQDCVPGDPANDMMKKVPPKSPFTPPDSSVPYPVPTCQEEWEEVAGKVVRDYGLESSVHVAFDGLNIDPT